MKSAIFTSIVAFAISSSALGINCRGSGFCPSNGLAGNLQNLKFVVDNIPQRNRFYTSGQQIACTGQLCAFFQKGASGTAQQVSGFMQQLLDHGCVKCGSVPTRGGSVNNGELTVNAVSSPSCQGAC